MTDEASPEPVRTEITTVRKTRRPGIIKLWLIALPVCIAVPAASTYFFGANEVDIPFVGTFDLAAEAAGALAVWGFVFWASLSATFLPILVAYGRRTRNRGVVAVINIVLGLTGVGWVVAVVMAFSSDVEPPLYVEKTKVSEGRDAPGEDRTAGSVPQKRRLMPTVLVVLAVVAAGLAIIAWVDASGGERRGSAAISDREAIQEFLYSFAGALNSDPETIGSFIAESNYPALVYPAAECRPSGPYWSDPSYTQTLAWDPDTLREDPGWTMEWGPMAGLPIDGTIYVMQVTLRPPSGEIYAGSGLAHESGIDRGTLNNPNNSYWHLTVVGDDVHFFVVCDPVDA